MRSKVIDIKSHLQQYAQLHLFWILRTEHIQPGLIHYLGTDGTPYLLMDDDDERVDKCIKFIEEMGCPIFSDVNEVDAYAKKLAGGNS